MAKPRREERREPGRLARAIGRLHRSLRETGGELRKVIWPSRPDVVKFTAVVIAAVTVVAIYIFLMDVVLSFATKPLFTGR